MTSTGPGALSDDEILPTCGTRCHSSLWGRPSCAAPPPQCTSVEGCGRHWHFVPSLWLSGIPSETLFFSLPLHPGSLSVWRKIHLFIITHIAMRWISQRERISVKSEGVHDNHALASQRAPWKWKAKTNQHCLIIKWWNEILLSPS